MARDEKAHEQTHDPDGVPTGNRQMSKQASDEVTPTSPTPLSGRPSGFIVGSTAPGHSEAPMISVEAPRAERGNWVEEYPQPASRLPERITAREIQADRSNPDGCSDSERQR